jgi:hypothetical protein
LDRVPRIKMSVAATATMANAPCQIARFGDPENAALPRDPRPELSRRSTNRRLRERSTSTCGASRWKAAILVQASSPSSASRGMTARSLSFTWGMWHGGCRRVNETLEKLIDLSIDGPERALTSGAVVRSWPVRPFRASTSNGDRTCSSSDCTISEEGPSHDDESTSPLNQDRAASWAAALSSARGMAVRLIPEPRIRRRPCPGRGRRAWRSPHSPSADTRHPRRRRPPVNRR